jgi:hypothetical protein
MNIQRLSIPATDLEDRLLPELLGSVFHVTSRSGYEGIMETGAILNNRDNRFKYTYPQSADNFGRKRGWVCLFDLRDVPDEELEWALKKLYFLNPGYCQDNPIFLILDESFHDDVLSWRAGNLKEVRIPHVEAWYPSDIDVAKIWKVIDVTVEQSDEEHPFLQALREASRRPGQE